MKTITLSVKERLLLLPLIPDIGSRMAMIISNSIINNISMTPDEVTEFELKGLPNGGGVIGNVSKFKDKDFDFSDEQIIVIKKIPAALDQSESVTVDLLPLFDKIEALKDSNSN